MIAEILSTGDEIRTGAVVDTNAAFIAEKLEDAGTRVQRHHCVGDDRQAIADLLGEIGRRADIAIITGGLGPTADDLTAEAAAHAAGVKLVLRQDALDLVRAFFQKRGRLLSETNRKQAILPPACASDCQPGRHGSGVCAQYRSLLLFFSARCALRNAVNDDRFRITRDKPHGGQRRWETGPDYEYIYVRVAGGAGGGKAGRFRCTVSVDKIGPARRFSGNLCKALSLSKSLGCISEKLIRSDRLDIRPVGQRRSVLQR